MPYPGSAVPFPSQSSSLKLPPALVRKFSSSAATLPESALVSHAPPAVPADSEMKPSVRILYLSCLRAWYNVSSSCEVWSIPKAM